MGVHVKVIVVPFIFPVIIQTDITCNLKNVVCWKTGEEQTTLTIGSIM